MDASSITLKKYTPDWLKVSIVLVFIIGIPITLGVWYQSRVDTVTDTANVGTALNATFDQSDLNGSTTRVETTEGTFYVYGILQVMKGHNMVLETRENGDKYLCDHTQRVCDLLAQ